MTKSKTRTQAEPQKAEAHDHDHDHDHYITGKVEGRAYLNGPGIENMPVDYVVKDGICYGAGCIELGPLEEVTAEAARIENEIAARNADGDDDTFRGVGLPQNSGKLWPNGIVYYTIKSDVPDKGRVDDAIKHIEENSAIRFIKRTSQSNYCEIVSNGNKGWSSSKLGMVSGKQLIRFSDRHSWPILVHEFCHALGIFHEHTRSDRDDYVEIKYDNIDPDFVGNFNKSSASVDYYDYDYGSIMHYGTRNFAIDSSKPTIVPKQSGVSIGQRSGLSWGDRQTIAKMYSRFFETGYTGVWRSGTGRYGLWVNADWDSFRNKWQDWSASGLRLHDIQVRRTRRGNRYSGVFLPGTGGHGLWANVDWTSFRNKWQQWSGQGLRLVDMNIHRVNGQNRYSGAFLPGSGPYGLWVNTSWDSFRDKWQEWSRRGMRLVDINVMNVNGQNRYSGVFVAGSGGYALWANASWASFRAKWKELSDQGLRLVDINLHKVNGQTRYSGVFMQGNDGYYLWANVTYEGFRAKWQELAGKGLRLIDFEFPNDSSIGARTDVADMTLRDFDADALAADTDGDTPFGGIFEGDGEAEISAGRGSGSDNPENHGGLMLDGDAGARMLSDEATSEDLGGAVFAENGGAMPASNGHLGEDDDLRAYGAREAENAPGDGAVHLHS